jgi:hypothetical protein
MVGWLHLHVHNSTIDIVFMYTCSNIPDVVFMYTVDVFMYTVDVFMYTCSNIPDVVFMYTCPVVPNIVLPYTYTLHCNNGDCNILRFLFLAHEYVQLAGGWVGRTI